jgi:hypothetical protein
VGGALFADDDARRSCLDGNDRLAQANESDRDGRGRQAAYRGKRTDDARVMGGVRGAGRVIACSLGADRERVSGGGSRHLRCDGGGEKRLKSEHEGRKDPDPPS